MTVLIVILAVLAVILLIPVGVVGGYDFGDIELKIIAGPVKIRIFPRKPKAEKPAEVKEKKAKKEKPEKPKKLKKPKPLTLDILTDYIRLGTKVLGKFRRKLSINQLRFYYLVAGADPYEAAVNYGAANAATANILSLLHAAFHIKRQDVRIRVDFLAPKPQLSIGADMTIRLWEILSVGVVALIGFLKILNKQKKRQKLTAERTDRNGEKSDRGNDGDHNVKNKGNGGCQHHCGDACNNA
ncbi:MAG: DUF2953 domain-containing protein [Oscillospiraceae bacterium]